MTRFPDNDAVAFSSGSLESIPDLAFALQKVQRQLTARGQLGLLSICVLRRQDLPSDGDWRHYESLLEEISVFLKSARQRWLRKTDLVLDPLLSGNTFVVLLGPPREDRVLDMGAVSLVRHRMFCGVTAHLEGLLPRVALEHHRIAVGGAVLRHDPSARFERLIYRGIEEAIADGLREREREGVRQAESLQQVLESGEIGIVYQPVVDLIARSVVGIEALSRPPVGQFPSPDRFIRVAHENRALWLTERLCRRRALEELHPIDARQFLFLNIEPESVFDPLLCHPSFLEQLRSAGLQPAQLVLEVTEHAAVGDFAALRRALELVRSQGFRLAMDDVGSGYAGLQAIAELRPDFLKLDMTLVRDLHVEPIKRQLVETIRRFTDSTGITLVAEGVEDPAELESLLRAGVRCAQGYLFARPDCPPRAPDWDQLPLSRILGKRD